ncbi:MAG: SAM-dependent methyltransferase [Luteolibacter sp.]
MQEPENMETFERFMQRALHDPVRGYYARNIRGIGAKGDFTTAPQLSQAPPAAIAAWAARALRQHRCRDLIEIGPGLGTLASQVFQKLPWFTRLRTRLHLVESSPALAARQKETLGNKASYHTNLPGALAACSGKAIIYSNELVDAFPVRLFEKTQEGWQEIAIDKSAAHLRETLLPPAELPPSSIFQLQHSLGQRVEIHESYRLWMNSWLPLWKCGSMLTIDYGDTAEKLYTRQPKGSLRAYFLHQRLVGDAIYANPGMQDITADVNFTDLADWTENQLQSDEPTDLSDFIRPFLSASDTPMIDAAGHFRTLIQTRQAP